MAYQQLLRNNEWHSFSKKVKQRDEFKCVKCERKEGDVILQVHHERYSDDNRPPWEYPMSCCITLCKGCHAREHGIVQPNEGWSLIEINDLGALDGRCERAGCGRGIRFEHVTYHPAWGYLNVGSECINHLTKAERAISEDALKVYKQADNFINQAVWATARTKQGKKYQYCTYKQHKIRIYEWDNNFSIQVLTKHKGRNFFDYSRLVDGIKGDLLSTKELAYIFMRGKLTEKESEKKILRSMYRALSSRRGLA